MKRSVSLCVAVLALLAGGCATRSKLIVLHVDTTQPDAMNPYPEQFAELDSDHADLYLIAFHALGDHPVEFDVTLEGSSETIEVWSRATLPTGVNPFKMKEREDMLPACKLCMLRLPPGQRTIRARMADGPEQAKTVELARNERKVYMVYFSLLGTLIAPGDALEP